MSRLAPLLGAWWCYPVVADAKDREVTGVPVIGGDSDVGFGGGYMLSYASTPKGYEPYFWRLESAGAMTFKPPEAGGGLQIPYFDDYLQFHFPQLQRDRLELEVRLSYTREATLKFYGLGNASALVPGLPPTDPWYEHARAHPTLRSTSTWHATQAWRLLVGLSYTYNQLAIPTETLLWQTMQQGSQVERRLLGAARDHGVITLSSGVALDTRDDEVTTTRGFLLSARADLSPSGLQGLPYAWVRLLGAAQGYLPLVNRRLMLAGRVSSDLLVGNAPFYELPRFDDSYFGGGKGVRGVPAQRYWGKAKLLGNLELRSNLFSFRFWNKENWFGLTAFFDAGRVWADYQRRPELDGNGLGLKYGTGGGIRLTAGSSFVLRADVAHSPDAAVSGYLTTGQAF